MQNINSMIQVLPVHFQFTFQKLIYIKKVTSEFQVLFFFVSTMNIFSLKFPPRNTCLSIFRVP
jgi:hypothetical protein